MELVHPNNFPWPKKFQVMVTVKGEESLEGLMDRHLRLDELREVVKKIKLVVGTDDPEEKDLTEPFYDMVLMEGRIYELRRLYILGNVRDGYFLGLRVRQGREKLYVKVGSLSFVEGY